MSESLLGSTIPIELLVRDRRCIVVGASGEARGKVERLERAGARVVLFARRDELGELDPLVSTGRVELVERACEDADVEGAAVVFVATEHEALGERLATAARARGTLVCTLDRPRAATFVNPAVVDGPGLRLSLSSGGTAPGLLRRLREDLGALFASPAFSAFVRSVAAYRAALPPGERAEAVRRRLEGFRLEARFLFPPWFEDEG